MTNPDSSHGTQVALTAAAARDGTGIMGIAWNATIQMLRADDPGSCATPQSGTTGGCSFFDSAITRGIDQAVAAGAKVINLSMGGSPPETNLQAAIGRAAAAGIVVVVSAGNDGTSSTSNPDPFAVGLRQVGNGNVIIAGSVDAANTISSFSNEAGSESQWYLMARGERVCCVYENGQIKITTDSSGQQFVTVVSGTSFSAPQIAGAVALVRQYFPNLSAAQTVDLLLRTATDLGAVGTDTVYGRGLLNIGAAFAPQGTTSLAGDSTALVPIGSAGVITSVAMGDAVAATTLQAVVLDGYKRAYTVSLGLASTAPVPHLAAALDPAQRSIAGQAGHMTMAFTVSDRWHTHGLGQLAQLHLSPADAEAARVLAAHVAGHISPKASFALAWGMGADGLARSLRNENEPAFLVAPYPLSDFGFARQSRSALALRREFGGWALSLLAEDGLVLSNAWPSKRQRLNDQHANASFFRFGTVLDRSFGPLGTRLGISWLNERRTLLGARINPGLGGRGAESLMLDAGGDLRTGADFRISASWRQGWTHAHVAGSVAPGSQFRENAWAVDLSRENLFQRGDSLSFRISQPMRVAAGGINFMVPVTYSYDTQSAIEGLRRINLAPTGREIDRELAWRGNLAGGSLLTGIYWRSNPGHYATMPDEVGIGGIWSTKF